MFGFLKHKKNNAVAHIPKLEVDLHSHLIPGIDDGCRDMQESLTLLQAFESLGYKKVITTPHIMFDTYKNTKSAILRGLDTLRIEAQSRGITMQIEAASEYYLDEGFLSLIKTNELLLIDNTYVLFETSYMHRPVQLEEIIFEIKASGHTPLLAHPERYRYIKDPQLEYNALKNLGVKFQINLNALNGHYGRQAQKNAHFLSTQGMIDFLGSDAHSIKQVQNLSKVFESQAYQEIYKYNTIGNNALL